MRPPLTADEPEVVAPLAEASLVVVLIELSLVEFSCVGAAGQWWAGASIGAGQCDRSACMIAHLRMGGCRQSGQMWCWVHACGVLGAGGTPTTMRAVSNW